MTSDVQMTRFRFEKGPPVNFMLQSGGRVWAAVSQIDHERQHKSRYSLHTRRRATFFGQI
jgi:hypothetical protein